MKKKIIAIGALCMAAMMVSGCTKAENTDADKTAETEQTGLTEEDLADNEFLVHNVIMEYAGDEEYDIKKTGEDEFIVAIGQSTISFKGYRNTDNVGLTRRVIDAKNDGKDSGGHVYYTLDEDGMRYIVYIRYSTIEIKCEGDKGVLDDIICRKSNLDCCD